jgi:transcriptional regulator with XRE-family HTH domain
VETTTINARIKQIISLKQLTISSFSRKIGLVNGVTISKIINQNRKPSSKTIGRIINAFPKINYDWLVNGEGEMLKGSNEPKGNVVNDENLTLTSTQLMDFMKTYYPYTTAESEERIVSIIKESQNEIISDLKSTYPTTPLWANKVFDDMNTIKEKAKTENEKFFKSHEKTLTVVKGLEEEMLQMNKKIAKLDILIETIEKHNLIEKEKISNFIKNTK